MVLVCSTCSTWQWSVFAELIPVQDGFCLLYAVHTVAVTSKVAVTAHFVDVAKDSAPALR